VVASGKQGTLPQHGEPSPTQFLKIIRKNEFGAGDISHFRYSTEITRPLGRARRMEWMNNPAAPTNVEQILGCVETIRNNLVHGDKNTDNQRDNDLVESALFILNALYDEISPLPQFTNFVSQFENLNAPVVP
jgi:hypothetical protein